MLNHHENRMHIIDVLPLIGAVFSVVELYAELTSVLQ